jgi:hypothetical protein
MLRLPFSGTPILRHSLLVLPLVFAPLGASHAAVSVQAQMGPPLNAQSCASASAINYDLDENRFSFLCTANSLTYSCSPTNVDYGTGTQVITLNCQDNTGSAQGLVVNAVMDGVQNGNGNSDGICNNANNFKFELRSRKYTWTCDNGGGNSKNVSCWTSALTSHFDLNPNQFNMDCVTVVWRSDFEDFEPPSSEYAPPVQ